MDAIYHGRNIFLIVEIGEFKGEALRKIDPIKELEEVIDIVGVLELKFWVDKDFLDTMIVMLD